MIRTALLIPIMLAAGVPMEAGAGSVPASTLAPAGLTEAGFIPLAGETLARDAAVPTGGPQCAPLTWQSLYPWTHCHDWGHQIYGNGWGLPYFSIGFGGSGFVPIFPVGAYWGLDVRFLPLGWGHAHGPHLAGIRCSDRSDCPDRGFRPPAKSFTIERPPTKTADESDSRTAPAPALLFETGKTGIRDAEVPEMGPRRRVSTASGGSTGVDDVTPPIRWAPPGDGDGPEVVTLAPPTSRRLNSAQRTRPASTTWHRVYTAGGGSSTVSGTESRTRVRAIDRAVRQWRSQSQRRTSTFGARSVSKGAYPSRSSSGGGSASVRSKTGGKSTGAPPRKSKGSGGGGV